MAEFVPGKNYLSFDPVSFGSSRETSGFMHSFSQLCFKIIEDGITKDLNMKSFQDVTTRLSYVVLTTADSTDPDKATEEADLLNYQLQDGEYLVQVALYGEDPANQIGNMHQIFVKNLRSWDFYTSKDFSDNSPREVLVTFDARKEPVVKGLTFHTTEAYENTVLKWNDIDYKIKGLTLWRDPLIFVQDNLAMRIKHDDIVYEIDPRRFVARRGSETIYGRKTFTSLPQSSGTPTNANDLVTKEYVDNLGEKICEITINAKVNSSWCGTSEAKFFFTDGAQLYPLKMEEGALDKAKQPLLMIFTLEPQPETAPTRDTKQNILDHKLKSTEFLAEYYPSHLLGTAATHSSTRYQEPFTKGGVLLTGSSTSLEPQYKIAFKGLPQCIAKVSFGANQYVPVETSVTCTIGAKKEDGSQTTGTSKFNYQFSEAITSLIRQAVYTTGEQTIQGVKTFTVLPKSAAKPAEPTDLVTKSYVDSLQGGLAKAYSATLKMKKNDTAWFGFTRFKILLSDGTRLDISQVQDDSDTSTYAKPMAVVFKVVQDLAATVEEPTKKTAQQIEEYVLQEGEFKGTIEYVKALTSSLSISSNRGYYQPWMVYCISGNVKELSPVYKVTVSGLKCHMLGVAFEMGEAVSGSYDYHCDGCAVDFALDNKLISVDYNGPLDNATKINIEIPGEYIKEYVDTSSEQGIRGVKTFAKLPKSSATPTDADDLVTKKYLDDQLNPSTDVSVTITAETSSSQSNWCGISNVQLFLAKDVQLFPLKMEEGTLAGLKEPKLMIFTTEQQSSPAPTKVSKQEILDYKLRPGDYRGLLYTADLLGKNTVHSSTSWQDPFTKGQGYLTYGSVLNVPEPQIKFVVQGLGQIIAKVGVSEASYSAQNITASSTINEVTEEGSKTTGTNTNNFAFGEKLSSLFKNAVLTNGDQDIDGVKTFAQSPKSLAAPVEDTDLVTKGFADKNYLAMPVPLTAEIDITCEGSGYAAFSELKILLGEDKVLEALYLEKRESTPDAKPYRFIYKVSDLASYKVKQTPRKTGAEFDTLVMNLKEGEHLGFLSYSVAFNEQNRMNSYDVQTDPWWGYLLSSTENKKHIMAHFLFEELPLPFKGVQYKSGDKYNDFGYKANKYGAKFTYGQKAQEFELTPVVADHEFLVDSSALEPDVTKSFFVELKGNQTINGIKTFNKVPVTNGYPTAPNDLVTKKFIENNFIANPTSTRTYEALVKVKGNGGNWVGFSYFKALLADGTRLDLKYIENVVITNTTAPAAAVWHVVSDIGSEIKQPETKAKSFIDDYHLQAGEYKGTVSFYKVVGSFTPASRDINPWLCYVGYRDGYFGGIYGIKIDALDVPLKGVNFKFGDARPSSGYQYDCEKCVVVFSTELGQVEVEYTGDKSNGTEATIEWPVSSGLLGGFVTLDTEQTIAGVKTFAQAPKCSIIPNDENDLVNKFFSERRYIINVEPNMELVIGSTANGTSIYEAFSHLNITLTNGKRLEAKYIEDAINANDTPVSVILKTADDPNVQVPVPTRKDKGFMSSHNLLDGEYFAEMTFAEGVGKATTHGTPRQSCPWDSYLAYNLTKGVKTDIVKIVIKDFYAEIESVQFNVGDQYNGYDYVTDKFHFRAKYNGISLAEQTTQEPLSKKLLVKFNFPKGLFAPAVETVVKLKKDQAIDGVKTFAKLPQSTATPADEKDLVTKKFLDAEIAKLVARLEALESPKP